MERLRTLRQHRTAAGSVLHAQRLWIAVVVLACGTAGMVWWIQRHRPAGDESPPQTTPVVDLSASATDTTGPVVGPEAESPPAPVTVSQQQPNSEPPQPPAAPTEAVSQAESPPADTASANEGQTVASAGRDTPVEPGTTSEMPATDVATPQAADLSAPAAVEMASAEAGGSAEPGPQATEPIQPEMLETAEAATSGDLPDQEGTAEPSPEDTTTEPATPGTTAKPPLMSESSAETVSVPGATMTTEADVAGELGMGRAPGPESIESDTAEVSAEHSNVHPSMPMEPQQPALLEPPAEPSSTATPAPRMTPSGPNEMPGLAAQAVAGGLPWPDWLQIGGDIRFRQTYRDSDRLDRKATGHDALFQRYRARTWARILAADDLDINVGLAAEPRYYFRPDRNDPFINDEVLIDRLNITWRNVADLPITAVIGRQDIRLGSGWLVQRGTPLDGSRTYFFDAARLTWQLDEATTADLIYVENRANSSAWLHPIGEVDLDLEEQDARGAIAYLSRKQDSGRWDAYFIYKHDHNPNRAGASEADIYTLGGLLQRRLNDDWEVQFEIAPQFGTKNAKRLAGFATNNTLTYHLHDAVDSRLRLGYEYLSGDEDPDQHFDRLWGRARQYSRLYTGSIDAIDGRAYDSSNLHRISLAYLCQPRKTMAWQTTYHLLFADERATASGATGLSNHGMFRGQLLTSTLTLQGDEHLQHRIHAELFAPGDYYSDARNDVAVFLRYELLFTW